jgi:hypothetical protein
VIVVEASRLVLGRRSARPGEVGDPAVLGGRQADVDVGSERAGHLLA